MTSNVGSVTTAESARAPLPSPAATRTPEVIANTPTTLTSAAPDSTFCIGSIVQWMTDKLAAVWQWIADCFCPNSVSPDDETWGAMHASPYSGPHRSMDNETLQRICVGTHPRTFRLDLSKRLFEPDDRLNRSDENTLFKETDSNLRGGLAVFINGQRFTDSASLAASLRRRGLEEAKVLHVFSCLSIAGYMFADRLVRGLFEKLPSSEEKKEWTQNETPARPLNYWRAITQADPTNELRADIDFDGNTLRVIRLIQESFVRKIMPHATDRVLVEPLFRVSTVTCIDGATWEAKIRGVPKPLGRI